MSIPPVYTVFRLIVSYSVHGWKAGVAEAGQKIAADNFGKKAGIWYNKSAVEGLWLKVHASRRRKDPRNAAKVLLIMVRLRSKPCRGAFPERSSVMATPEQSFQQASVGSKTRSASIAHYISVTYLLHTITLPTGLNIGNPLISTYQQTYPHYPQMWRKFVHNFGRLSTEIGKWL
jgi:hypothetical protein